MGEGPDGLEGESHRGAFGEYGGEERGLIDRTFRERIVLVGVTRSASTDEDTDEALDELAQLVHTAGADEVARVTQRRQAPDPATFVGQGKARPRRSTRSPKPPTLTRWCSTTSLRPRSSSTWNASSNAPRWIARR